MMSGGGGNNYIEIVTCTTAITFSAINNVINVDERVCSHLPHGGRQDNLIVL